MYIYIYIGLPAICNFFRRTRCRERAPVRSWRTFHPHGQGGIFGISWPTSKLIFTVFFNTVKATASTLRICIKKKYPLFYTVFEKIGTETGRPSVPDAARSAAGTGRHTISKFFRRMRRRDLAAVRYGRGAERRRDCKPSNL